MYNICDDSIELLLNCNGSMSLCWIIQSVCSVSAYTIAMNTFVNYIPFQFSNGTSFLGNLIILISVASNQLSKTRPHWMVRQLRLTGSL